MPKNSEINEYQRLAKASTEEKIKSADKQPEKGMQETLVTRESIKNQSLAQDIKLKKTTLVGLFVFLGIETLAIFFFAWLQGADNGFQLEEWSFKLLVTVTILQITYMLRMAVQHLFPGNESN